MHVLNVQLHLYLILMWPILYPDFHNHTSLLAIQLNLYSWLQFFLLHGKILFHQKFPKTSLHCVLLISLTYLENQSVTGLFLKGSIQWQLKTLVFETLVLSHIRLNSQKSLVSSQKLRSKWRAALYLLFCVKYVIHCCLCKFYKHLKWTLTEFHLMQGFLKRTHFLFSATHIFCIKPDC